MQQSLYRIRVPDNLSSLIGNIHPHLKKKIRSSLKTILSNPDSGKTLRDDLAGLRSFRVSRLRIIYRVLSKEREIEVVAIGPRIIIYEETLRILKRKV